MTFYLYKLIFFQLKRGNYFRMSSQSDLDSGHSRDDLNLNVERKHRRQRRASSDILKSPKSGNSLFSKLSFSTELLNAPLVKNPSSQSLRHKTESQASLGSSAAESESGGRVSRWQISFDAVLGTFLQSIYEH